MRYGSLSRLRSRFTFPNGFVATVRRVFIYRVDGAGLIANCAAIGTPTRWSSRNGGLVSPTSTGPPAGRGALSKVR